MACGRRRGPSASAPLAILVVAAVLVIGACSSTADEPAAVATSTTSTTLVTVAAAELQVGDCLANLMVGRSERIVLSSVDVGDCALPHPIVVFARFRMTETSDDYPGREPVVRAADRGCEDALETTVVDAEVYGIVSFWPTNESWRAGDRMVVCGAFRVDGTPFSPSDPLV